MKAAASCTCLAVMASAGASGAGAGFASLGPVAALGLGALGARAAADGFTGRGGLAPLGALGGAVVLRLVLAPGWEIELVTRARWLFGLVATVDGVDALSWTGPEVALLLGTWWRR